MQALKRKINVRDLGRGQLSVSLDETVTAADLRDLVEVFSPTNNVV